MKKLRIEIQRMSRKDGKTYFRLFVLKKVFPLFWVKRNVSNMTKEELTGIIDKFINEVSG